MSRHPDPARTLADQLPESGFPSGVGTPSAAVLALLLLLAGLCAVLLDVHEYGPAPATAVESQVDSAHDVGAAIGAAAEEDIADLLAGATAPTADPERLLDRVLWNRDWRGAAVLDAARKPVATRGEPVSTTSLPATVSSTIITPVRGADGVPRLVLAKPLPDGMLLVAGRRARLPDAPPGGKALLLVSGGRVIDTAGARPGPEVDQLVRTAGAAAARGRPASVTGPDDGATRTVVAYAPVPLTGLDGVHGLAVVSATRTPVSEVDSDGEAVAISLICFAEFGFLLVRLVLVGPVRRLRADALDVASGRLETPVHRSAVWEVDRIAAAFEHCRSTLDDTPVPTSRPRTRIPAVLAVALAALAVLGWAVVVLVSVGGEGGELGRNGIVVALIGILFALLLFGWQYLLLIRPLRRVAVAADELVAGRATVSYPQHQDQIGTIASCLEVCRQALTDGIHRLGTVRRPTGTATEDTRLLHAVRGAG